MSATEGISGANLTQKIWEGMDLQIRDYANPVIKLVLEWVRKYQKDTNQYSGQRAVGPDNEVRISNMAFVSWMPFLKILEIALLSRYGEMANAVDFNNSYQSKQ